MHRILILGIAMAALSLLVTGCSGGGSGGSSEDVVPDVIEISGRTVDGQGLPVADVVVTIDTDPILSIQSGADGSFSVFVSPGMYMATFALNGTTLSTRAADASGPDAADLGDIQVKSTILGTIVGSSQDPIEGAQVILDTVPPLSVMTDATGQFVLEAIPGTYDLDVRINGIQVYTDVVVATLPGPASLGTVQVFTEVAGRIVDGLLEPLPGAIVTIDTTPETYLVTAADGTFSADVIAGGYQLRVSSDGIPLYQQGLMITGTPPIDIGNVQVLVRTVGRIVDDIGLPVADAEVSVNTMPASILTTGSDGSFLFDLPVGSFLMAVRIGGIIVSQMPLTALAGTGILDVQDITVNPGVDTDGDGLSNNLEISGWTILVNENGGDVITNRLVTSNPNLEDTDGDTLSDGEEFGFRTDPSLVDTDGDTMNDNVEIVMYRSNPNDIDTDKDARAVDAMGNPVGLPNPSLFDGAELNLSGTSPTLADTDGDGLRDTEEILGGGSNARIADQPLVDIELIADPLIALNATVGMMDVMGMVQRQEGSQSRSDSQTTQRTSENTQMVSASASVSYPWGASLSVDTSASWKQGTFNEHQSNFTTSSTNALQQSLQTSSTTTFSDATISGAFRVINRSDLSFLVQDLRILVYRIRPSQGAGALEVIGSLSDTSSLLGGSNPGVLLAPQSDFSYVASNDSLNYQPVLDYLAEPGGLLFEVGSYSLKQVDDQGNPVGDYDAIAQRVVERTGLIVIDYGNGEIERFNVATNVERNPDGSAAGISMADAMDLIGVSYSTTTGTAPASPTPGFPSAAGRQLLTTVDGRSTSPPSEPAPAKRWWVVTGPRTTEMVGGEEFFVDFQDLRLMPGERYTLIYLTDDDQDRLTKREEDLFGTSDNTCDTDLDMLSDFYEVKVGWEVEFRDCVNDTPASQFNYHVFPNPRLVDADGDGLSDLNEAPANLPPFVDLLNQGAFCAVGVANPGGKGTDPNVADTDGDGDIDSTDDCIDAPANPGGTIGLPSLGLWAYYRMSAVDVVSGMGSGSFVLDRSETGGNNARIRDIFLNVPFNGSIGAGDGGTYVFPDRFGRAAASYRFFNDPICDGFGYTETDADGADFIAPSLSFTWSAWIYNDNTNNEAVVMGVEDWVQLVLSNNEEMGIQVHSGDFPSSPTWRLQELTPMPDDTWVYYAVTVDFNSSTNETLVRLYRGLMGGTLAIVAEEGTEAGFPVLGSQTGMVPSPLVNPVFQGGINGAFTVGHGLDAFGDVYEGNGFQGAVDDVRLYDRALAQTEINALFNEPPSMGN